MIKPEGVLRWAESQFDDYLRSLITGEQFFPRRKTQIGRVGAAAGVVEFRDEVQALWDASKNTTGRGYTVILEERIRRSRGVQNEPTAVEFETASDFLSSIGRETEAAAFVEDVALILARMPELRPALLRSPKLVVAEHGHWPKIIAVVDYLRAHPGPGCYVRALPVRVETKFIERHTAAIELVLGELQVPGYDGSLPTFATRCGMIDDTPLLRARFLCDQLRKDCGFPSHDVTLPISDWAKITLPADARVLGCENKANFLSLPILPRTLALFGAGGAATGHFLQLPWLRDRRFVYWGDLDPCGLNILAYVRSGIPRVRSVLMDEDTLLSHKESLVSANLPPREIPLEELRGGEIAAAISLCGIGKGIEQERLLFSECVDAVKRELDEPWVM